MVTSCRGGNSVSLNRLRFYFLQRQGSFNFCRCWSSVSFNYMNVCWGSNIKKKKGCGGGQKLDELVRRTDSVSGLKLDRLESLAERRTRHSGQGKSSCA